MGKVLLLSNIPTPYQLDFLDRFAALHDVRAVFLWRTESNRDWQLDERRWIEFLDHHRWIATARRLVALLREMRPDAIILGGHRLPFAGLVKWWGLLRGIRVVYWLERPLPRGPFMNWARRWVWRARLPFAYGVAGIGAGAVSVYAPFSRRALNLPYSIDVSRYRASRGEIGNGPVRFLFVGQLIHRKGVPELLEAFATVPSGDAELTVAGSGELRSLVESYVHRFTHIHYAGFVGPAALPRLYGDHDVLIAPSHHDGWAVVVCEAMAAGMPVVGTAATGAFSEYVRHGHNGFRCDVTAESIRDGVLYYCRQKSLIRIHGNLNLRLLTKSDANAVNSATRLSSWLGLSR